MRVTRLYPIHNKNPWRLTRFDNSRKCRKILEMTEKRTNPLLQLFPTSSEFKSELGYETAVPQSPLENYSGQK